MIPLYATRFLTILNDSYIYINFNKTLIQVILICNNKSPYTGPQSKYSIHINNFPIVLDNILMTDNPGPNSKVVPIYEYFYIKLVVYYLNIVRLMVC
jgi:hypothetical protein